MAQELYPLLIIGGGPAGLTAGIYSCRSGIRTLLVAPIGGGLASSADRVENYPGFPEEISGMDLVQRMKEQAEKFGLEVQYGQVQKVLKEKNYFRVLAEDTFLARAVIVATGAEPSKLGVPGENEFWGRGVSYCATCDGPFFRDKSVVVVGGGDSALQEALYLARMVKDVTIVHRRDHFRAAQYLQEMVKSTENISLKLSFTLSAIKGQEKVKGVVLKHKTTDFEEFLPTDAVFIYVGLRPNSEIVKELVKTDERGGILTDELMRTSQEGIFACGDVRATPLRQIITACSDGAIAAISVYDYLNPEK